jgi:hypothetical protein
MKQMRFAFCLLSALLTFRCFAQTVLTASGRWTNEAIWSDGVPVSGEITTVGGGYTVTVESGDVAQCGRITIGGTSSEARVIVQSGASLTTGEFRLGAGAGFGMLDIHGGSVTSTTHFMVGYSSTATKGIVNMTNGHLAVNAGSFRIPNQGSGTINLSGGSITSRVNIVLGYSDTGPVSGVFNQSGGSVVCAKSVIVGNSASATNIIYNISGGSLSVAESLTVGYSTGIGRMKVSGADASITARDVTIGSNGVYEVCLVNGAASTIVAQGGDAAQNITLDGTLKIGSLDGGKSGNVQLFRMDGGGQIMGSFASVVWNDGLTGEVLYSSDEVRLRAYPAGTLLSVQ